MMNPGLDAAGVERMKRILCSPHHVKITVAILDLDHNYLADLSGRLYDGQVNFSAASEISRSATLTLWDPDFEVGLDRASPEEGALYYNRMIRITYSIWEYGDTKSIDIPLFTGPIDPEGGVSRDGGMLEVRCLGKEKLSMSSVWTTYNFKAGANKVAVLKSLMQNRGGETRFDLEPSAAKYGSKGVTFAKEAIVWDEASKIAAGLGKQLFYDGRGVLRLRTRPSSVAFTFRDGRGGSIVTLPKLGTTDQEAKNIAWVVGTKPKGAKTTPSAVSVLPSSHPLNHYNIGRTVGGKKVPRVLLAREDISTVTKSSVAKTRANQKRDSYAYQQLGLTAEVLAMPFLEESDLVFFEVQDRYSVDYRVEEMSIPFTGPVASMGSSKNLALKARK